MKVHTRIINAIVNAWAYLLRQERPSIDIGDLQVAAGFIALTYGVSMVSVPAAWILAGALLLIGWAIPRMQFTRRVKE